MIYSIELQIEYTVKQNCLIFDGCFYLCAIGGIKIAKI